MYNSLFGKVRTVWVLHEYPNGIYISGHAKPMPGAVIHTNRRVRDRTAAVHATDKKKLYFIHT